MLGDIVHQMSREISKDSTRGETGITFAVLHDDSGKLNSLKDFVHACENQTILPDKVIVNSRSRKPLLPFSHLNLELQHSIRAASLKERIQDLMSSANCSYLVVFADCEYYPEPFFCERAAFHASHFSPDAIFFEALADPTSSLAHSCLGSGTNSVYIPESVAIAIQPLRSQFNEGELKRNKPEPALIRSFLLSVYPDRIIPRRKKLESFERAILEACALSSLDYLLVLKGRLPAGQIGNVYELNDPEHQPQLIWPNSFLEDRQHVFNQKSYKCGRPSFNYQAVKNIGQYFDPTRETLQNFTSKTLIAQDQSTYSDRDIVEMSGFFDPKVYRTFLPSGAAIPSDALAHFLDHGWLTTNETSKFFNSSRYLSAYTDVKNAGINPLVHYLRYGRTEGRFRWGRNGQVPGLEEGLLLSSGLFDPDYYMSMNTDLLKQDVDPIWHFLKYGGNEGRNPSVYFDCLGYLIENSDVVQVGINPLLHYELHGKKEGRQIRPANDTPWRSRVAARQRMTDRAEWRLDAEKHEPVTSWLEKTIISENCGADILCCLPYMVRDNLTLRLMDRTVERGSDALITIQHPTPNSYAEDIGPWSRRPNRIIRLYDVVEEQSYVDFISHLIHSRKIRTLLIAGSADIYQMLPQLKRDFSSLFVVDQLFNTTGHTRLSLTFSPYIDRYIVESLAMKDFLSSRGVDPERITILISGIDLERFSRTQVTSESVTMLRSQCGFDESVSFIVGYVGRMSPEKDPLGFVQIAREITSHRSDIGFLIAGSGPMLDEVKEEVNRILPAGLARVVGFVDDVRHAMSSCDLLVLPSKVDGRPNAIMESNALGVPVIGSSIGGIGELIKDGVNGYLIRPGAYSDFATKIRELADNPSLQKKLSQNALDFASAHFNQMSMFENFFNIISRRPGESRGT